VEGETNAAYAIDLVIVLWLLDVVPADDGVIAVVVVRLVGGEVDLSEELLLVMLEFSDHVGWRPLNAKIWLVRSQYSTDRASSIWYGIR
jgi:hypothetical protein